MFIRVTLAMILSAGGARIATAPQWSTRHSRPELGSAARFGCHKLDGPKQMPGLDQLLDSAALMASLKSLETAPAVDVEFSLQPANPVASHVVDEKDRTPANLALLKDMIPMLRRFNPALPEAFRLRVKSGKKLEIKVDRSTLCDPVNENGTPSPVVSFGVTSGKVAGTNPSPESKAAAQSYNTSGEVAPDKLRALVSTQGSVTKIEFLVPTDDVTAQNTRSKYLTTKYRPALLDGEPVAVWVNGVKVELAR